MTQNLVDAAAARNFDLDAALFNSRARCKEQAPRIREQYGNVIDGYISTILRVEDEQAVCEGCGGDCPKAFFRYKKPTVTVAEGVAYVSNIPCKFGVDHEFRCQCVNAGVPEKYIGGELGDYRVTSDNDRAVKIAKYMIDNRPNRGAFFYGGCGTGKTYLASLIAQGYLHAGLTVRFFDMPGLLTDIKDTFDTKRSTGQLLDEICDCALLVVDDMGAEKVTEWSVEQLYLIVNQRYNRGLPMVATSNFDLNTLEKRLGDDITARRITSRLSTCYQAFFGKKDWRSSNVERTA